MVAADVLAVVLVKDFAHAKQRLGAELDAGTRANLARANAIRALEAAKSFGSTIAVACGEEAIELCRSEQVEVVRDPCSGQNDAGLAGIRVARERAAEAVLLLSSDLPLVSAGALESLLAHLAEPPAAVAAAAEGRGGTNALLVSPPDALPLSFGDRSLEKFEADARRLGVNFAVVESAELALDLDEPSDLARLREMSIA